MPPYDDLLLDSLYEDGNMKVCTSKAVSGI